MTAIVCLTAVESSAQIFNTTLNLVTNGNFEVGSNQGGAPAVPGWIQGPNPFELIAVGDDGSTGAQSVGFNTNVTSDQFDPSTWADWLSRPITVVPGEKLLWRFRYKMTNHATTPEGEVLADSRGFTGVDVNGNPTTYLGTGGLVVLPGTAGMWTSVEKLLEVPAGATALDLRFNQIFTAFTTIPWRGSFRLDDVAIYRELNLRADFNSSGGVDGTDLTTWKTNYPTATNATKSIGDADGDGAVNGADFLIWQREVGVGAAVPAMAAVPEPATAALLGLASLGMLKSALASTASRRIDA